MSELKPCPFCGGEADEYEGDYGNGIYCMMCGAMIGEPIHEEYRVTERVSYEQAAKAWNTRAERTCECVAEYAKSPIDGKTIVLHRCSACHELMRPHMAYCPNCGAKVV